MAQIVKAKIENGVVVEAFLLDEDQLPLHLQDWVTAPVEVGDGWNYDGVSFTPPSSEYMWQKLLPIRENMKLSFAQLLIGLVQEGWITEAEGDAWVDGKLPDAVLAVIAELPEKQQFAARTRAKRPTEVVRTDPLVLALSGLMSKSVEDLDQFFSFYSKV